MVFCDKEERSSLFEDDSPIPSHLSGSLSVVSGWTDNQGNSFVVDKLMTTTFPLFIILMELSAQLRIRNLGLDLRWIPREQNVEADAVTNEEFGEFSDCNRIEIELEQLPFLVLKHLMTEAGKLDAEIKWTKEVKKRQLLKGGGVEEPIPKQAKEKLRFTQPW